MYPRASKAGLPVPKPSDTDSVQTYQSTGNDYYRTWQLSRHGGQATLPPPYIDHRHSQQYPEHIYESPKFERKTVCSTGYGHDGEAPTDYYELDPESVEAGYSSCSTRQHRV